MKVNKILNDFGKDGLEIDISTRTYPNKSILIDRDIYEDMNGRITANGSKYVIITLDDSGKKMYLGRYILDLDDSDKLRVICKDGLRCDYRRDNLEAVDRTEVKRTKVKTVRNIHLALIRKRLKEFEMEDLHEEEILNAVDEYFKHYDSI